MGGAVLALLRGQPLLAVGGIVDPNHLRPEQGFSPANHRLLHHFEHALLGRNGSSGKRRALVQGIFLDSEIDAHFLANNRR